LPLLAEDAGLRISLPIGIEFAILTPFFFAFAIDFSKKGQLSPPPR
jgi:hypothetical protein